MRFVGSNLAGAWLIEAEKHEDERGYFSRIRCSKEFLEHGLPGEFVQTNLSHNRAAQTFRGLHFQVPPSREGKLVRCVRGSVLDVIVDLRPDSDTFLKHQWLELSYEGLQAVYVPTGFAHGFLTRTDDTIVMYEMSDYYAPDLSRGMRWNDPLLDISMPEDVAQIHPRDAAYPDVHVDQLACFEGWRA